MGLPEPGERWGNEHRVGGGERSESHPSRVELGELSQSALGAAQMLECRGGVLEQLRARVGQRDRPRGALDQRHRGLAFERGDVLRDGRLRVVKRARCGGERAMGRNRLENLEPAHVEHQ